MAIIQKCKPLAGGIDLNYEVVGGTTAPTTFKKENTIWVNTDVEITGHAFEYNAPNYLTTSDIWIQTDIDKAPVSFNAIKKNELMVYPARLKRWDGNGWKSLGGALYQGGMATLVYSAGEVIFPDQYSTLTKGTGGDDGAHTATISSSKISLYSSWGNNGSYSNASKAFVYSPVIDFSQYTKLTVTYSKLLTSSPYWTHAIAKVGILNSTSVTVYNNNGCTEQGDNNWIWSQEYVTDNSDNKGTITYDISKVTSKARLWFLVYTYTANAYMDITKIVLE